VDFDDGHDAVEWAASQPWSNGRVGMFGSSYGGMVQWAAAATRPPHLVAIAPTETAWRFSNMCYRSRGILNFDIRVAWTALMAEHEAERRGVSHPVLDAAVTMQEVGAAALEGQGSAAVLAASMKMRTALSPLFKVRPARELDVFKDVAPWWSDWLGHIDPEDEFWTRLSGPPRVADIQVPAIHHTGWYDFFLVPTLEAFKTLREHGANERVRDGQRLVIGPWAHGLSGRLWEGHLAGMGVPDPARQAAALRFLDLWLNHDGVGDQSPPIRLFVMGPNLWRDEYEWPLRRTRWTDLYLGAGGTLLRDSPGEEPPDTYVYDPENPVPQHGGPLVQMMCLPGPGPFDQREIEARDDVLVYTSAPLDADLEVTGPVRVEHRLRRQAGGRFSERSRHQHLPGNRSLALRARDRRPAGTRTPIQVRDRPGGDQQRLLRRPPDPA
jgi:putative CocE/NonD family hydrolase